MGFHEEFYALNIINFADMVMRENDEISWENNVMWHAC